MGRTNLLVDADQTTLVGHELDLHRRGCRRSLRRTTGSGAVIAEWTPVIPARRRPGAAVVPPTVRRSAGTTAARTTRTIIPSAETARTAVPPASRPLLGRVIVRGVLLGRSRSFFSQPVRQEAQFIQIDRRRIRVVHNAWSGVGHTARNQGDRGRRANSGGAHHPINPGGAQARDPPERESAAGGCKIYLVAEYSAAHYRSIVRFYTPHRDRHPKRPPSYG